MIKMLTSECEWDIILYEQKGDFDMNYEQIIDLSEVTVQDCLDLFKMKRRCTILNDGKIVDFRTEEEMKESGKF